MSDSSILYVNAPITKTTRDDDGNLYVYGKLTGPDLDLDGQIMDADWLKAAVPQWFESGANIRLMHQPVAVGVGTELEQDGDDWWLTSKVVDPYAQRLVDEGVLTSYSIGVKSPKLVKDASAPNGRVKGGKIVESSLVDRGCNETTKLVLAKAVEGDVLVEVEGAEVETVEQEAEETDYIQVARDALAQWLVAEANEVRAGTGTARIVRLIANLLGDLDWAEEADEYDDAQAVAAMKAAALHPAPTPSEEDTMLTLSTVADLVKSATADDAPADDQTAVADLRDALGLDDIATALTKAATAEDLQGVTDALEKVAARLAKVEDMASNDGPTRAAPTTDHPANAKRVELLEKAAAYRHTASQVTDRNAAAAYLDLAAQHELTATQL